MAGIVQDCTRCRRTGWYSYDGLCGGCRAGDTAARVLARRKKARPAPPGPGVVTVTVTGPKPREGA